MLSVKINYGTIHLLRQNLLEQIHQWKHQMNNVMKPEQCHWNRSGVLAVNLTHFISCFNVCRVSVVDFEQVKFQRVVKTIVQKDRDVDEIFDLM